MRIAIVSYFAPPQRVVASHRVMRMSRALLLAGHEVHWVTADVSDFADPKRSLDDSLCDLIPTAVRQHRIGGEAVVTLPAARNFREKIKRSFVFEMSQRFAYADGYFGWARLLKKQLPKMVHELGLEAVVLCCKPHSQIGCIPKLSLECSELQIYADYRDLLSGNPWNKFGSDTRRRRLLDWERHMLLSSDAVFVNTEQAKVEFDSTVALKSIDVEVMRNTADYALADQIFADAAPEMLGPGRHLGFFGSIFPRRRLANFLSAMEKLRPELLDDLTLHVYCDAQESKDLLDEDRKSVSPEVAKRVVRHDYLDYTIALRTMRAMDALVLVNGSGAADAVFVPGKLYDYLMARRPILFLGHPGDASRLVGAACGETWCFGDDDPTLPAALERLCAGRPADVGPLGEVAPETTFGPLLDRLS